MILPHHAPGDNADSSAPPPEATPTRADVPRPLTKKEVEASSARPSIAPVLIDNVPEELRARPQWVAWGYYRTRDRTGKWRWTKVPLEPRVRIYARRGTVVEFSRAKSTDPRTWNTLDYVLQAIAAASEPYGLGFVFSADDPYFGIDLDDARNRDTGELTPAAREIVAQFDSYAEPSPSGTGVKIIAKGKKPGTRCKNDALGIEVYDHARYFTVTGQRLDGISPLIEERQAQLDAFYAFVFPARVKAANDPQTAPGNDRAATGRTGADEGIAQAALEHAGRLEDQAVIGMASRARNGAKFTALWAGDTSYHNNDNSSADIALASILAFYVGPDHARIERLMWMSALKRDKWNRPDYLPRTIARVLETRTEFYRPGYRPAGETDPMAEPFHDDPAARTAFFTQLGEVIKQDKERKVEERRLAQANAPRRPPATQPCRKSGVRLQAAHRNPNGTLRERHAVCPCCGWSCCLCITWKKEAVIARMAYHLSRIKGPAYVGEVGDAEWRFTRDHLIGGTGGEFGWACPPCLVAECARLVVSDRPFIDRECKDAASCSADEALEHWRNAVNAIEVRDGVARTQPVGFSHGWFDLEPADNPEPTGDWIVKGNPALPLALREKALVLLGADYEVRGTGKPSGYRPGKVWLAFDIPADWTSEDLDIWDFWLSEGDGNAIPWGKLQALRKSLGDAPIRPSQVDTLYGF